MTKDKLIKELQKLEGDPVIIVRDSFGWANIKMVDKDEVCGVILLQEDYSMFSEDN